MPQNVTYRVASSAGVVDGVGVTTYRQVQLYRNPREFGVNFTARFGSR